jgi:phosphoesterase RecJ-like protein
VNAVRDNTLEELLVPIAACRSPLLIGHVRADVDCIGSLAAMDLAMRAAGLSPVVAIQRALVPQRLQRLCEWAGVCPSEYPDVAAADLAIVLDTATKSRLNIYCGLGGLASLPLVNIDHHVTNERFGRWNYVDAQASSTSELVFELLTRSGWPITPMVATMLYAGIHGDTGGFSFPNTRLRSLEVASKLAGAGAQIAEVCQSILRSQTRSEFDLLRLIYDNTRVSDDGRVAWSKADHAEIVSTGCNHTDIDEQVSVPRSLEGAEIALLFTEGLPGSVRINFRGEGDMDVLTLAKEFGGGGHKNSAGTIIRNQPIDQVVDRIVARAVAYLAERYPL